MLQCFSYGDGIVCVLCRAVIVNPGLLAPPVSSSCTHPWTHHLDSPTNHIKVAGAGIHQAKWILAQGSTVILMERETVEPMWWSVLHSDGSSCLSHWLFGNLNGQSSPAHLWENDKYIFCSGICRTAMMPGCCFRVSNVLLGVFQHVIGHCWMVTYSQKSWCLWWCLWAYLLPSQSKTT